MTFSSGVHQRSGIRWFHISWGTIEGRRGNCEKLKTQRYLRGSFKYLERCHLEMHWIFVFLRYANRWCFHRWPHNIAPLMCPFVMTLMLSSWDVAFNYLPLNLGWPYDLFWPIVFGRWDAALFLRRSQQIYTIDLCWLECLFLRVRLSYKEAQVGPLMWAPWNLPDVLAVV